MQPNMTLRGPIGVLVIIGLTGALYAQEAAPKSKPSNTAQPPAREKAIGDGDLFDPQNQLPCEFFGPCGRCDCPTAPGAKSNNPPKTKAK